MMCFIYQANDFPPHLESKLKANPVDIQSIYNQITVKLDFWTIYVVAN